MLLLGITRGLLLGLAGVGIVLIFRSSRVVNLAQGQLGALVAAGFGRLVLDHGVPYFVAFPAALVLGALLGVVVDVGVVARLRDSPRIVVTIATVAVSELCVVAVALLPKVRHNGVFPTGIHVDLSGSLRFQGPEVMVLATVPATVVALTLFLRLTPTGLALRAATQNPEAAALAGISPRRLSATVWAIAGAISALTGLLTQALDRTTVAVSDPGFTGSTLLLSALAAAVIGGLRSLPLALLGGLVVGEGTDVAEFSGQSLDRVNAILLGIVLAAVVVQAVLARGSDPDAAVSLTRGRLPVAVPGALRGRWWARRSGGLATVVLFGLGALVPAFDPSAGSLSLATRVVLFAMLGLSLTVLTSWAGQLSLGQVAVYAIAAVVAARLVAAGVPFLLALLASVLVGAAVSLLLALPALIARGSLLAVVTLAVAIVVPDNVFSIPGLRGVDGLSIRRPGFASSTSAYYLFCLVALGVVTTAVVHLRSTGTARRIIAARSNPRRAASLSIDVIEARLTAFVVSGALAGLAGGLLAGEQRQLSPGNFPALDSLLVVAVVAIGGFSSSLGPLLGALFVIGLPAVYRNSATADDLTAGFGLLAVLLYVPGGLASLLLSLREAVFTALTPRFPVPAPPVVARAVGAERLPPPAGVPALSAVDLSFSVRGRTILDKVSLEVTAGEVLAVVGANGAGKSTLLAALAGELAATGRVWIHGREATGSSAEVRASAGLGRVFQDATLFGDLTTAETVAVALEAADRSGLAASLLSLPRSRQAERGKRAAAYEVMEMLGLTRYAELPVSRLSTGTRRIVELAVIVAQGARLLLLDEPTAGLAQREVEAFAPLLLQLRADLGATVVLVEHDLPLVEAVSDRLLCLGSGRVLATGTAEEVLDDPAVRASYLGQRRLSRVPAGRVGR